MVDLQIQKKINMNYKEARKKALDMANMCKREVGIEKVNEFGKEVFRVKHLPLPEYRRGWELRCEVVAPEKS